MNGFARRSRGLTLIEAMVALAIVAVLASLAVPSFGAQLARIHLKSAAERVAADLAEARFEATQRGVPLHVNFKTGAQWCYAVTARDACPCGSAQACQLRVADGHDHKGVVLESARDLHFEPSDGTSTAPGGVTLRSARGEVLRVELTRLGRAKVCAPESTTLGYPGC